MNAFRPHPAIGQLLRHQAAAKLARTLRSFRSRRRLFLSLLGVALGAIWVGQAVAGVFLREPADPERLAVWIPLGLAAFAAWSVLKVVFRNPNEPFEWTDAEREWLSGSPLPRADLVRYRVSAIAWAAIFKATIFSIVMIPDLHNPVLGLFGMLIALLFIELLRMTCEVVAYALSKFELLLCRLIAIGLSAGAILAAVSWAFDQTGSQHDFSSLATFAFVKSCFLGLVQAHQTLAGQIFFSPFNLFSTVVLSGEVTLGLLTQIGASIAIIVAMARLVIGLDQWQLTRRQAAEISVWPSLKGTHTELVAVTHKRSGAFLQPPRLAGIGSLAWRQLLGVYHYRTSIMTAMAVPFALACLPLTTQDAGSSLVINVVAGLGFYTFLLLPTILKFDFRRDIDRISNLKALPMSPLTITIGQLAVPVLMAMLFQFAVLLVVMYCRPVDTGLFVASICLLIPVNVFVFAVENLMFLLYPYRVSEEGIQVFVRSILTFTAKGLIFAAALAIAYGCMIFGNIYGPAVWTSRPRAGATILFAAGMGAIVVVVATVFVVALARTFRRFDPSQDLAQLG